MIGRSSEISTLLFVESAPMAASFAVLSDIFHRMTVNIKAGIDLRSTVKQLKKSSGSAGLVVFSRMEQDLQQGSSLAEAMKKNSSFFPQLCLALVEAGERGGRLDHATSRLSKYYKTLLELRKNFWTSLAWPLFELAMSIVIVGLMILAFGVIAAMTNTQPIDPFGFGWTPTGYFMAYCGLILTAATALTLGYYALIRGWLGTWPLDIARRIPLLGRTIQVMTLSRMAWALATGIEAGLSAIDSVRLGLNSTQQWYYQRHQPDTETSIRGGSTLTQTLAATHAFPDDFMLTIETGEISGEIPESLQHLADLYDDEAQRNLRTLSMIGATVVMLLIFVCIGAVVIYFVKTIYIDRLMELGNGKL